MEIEVNRDMVPGWGDKIEDFEKSITEMIQNQFGHYKPTVKVIARGISIANKYNAMSVDQDECKDCPGCRICDKSYYG